MKIIFYLNRVIEIPYSQENQIQFDDWSVLTIRYDIPLHFTVEDTIQYINTSLHASSKTDNVLVLTEQLTTKKIHRRSPYGFKPVQDNELMIPSNCDPDEVIEFILV